MRVAVLSRRVGTVLSSHISLSHSLCWMQISLPLHAMHTLVGQGPRCYRLLICHGHTTSIHRQCKMLLYSAESSLIRVALILLLLENTPTYICILG